MRIGFEAQRLLRSHKHGMDIVALETLHALAEHAEHELVVFTKPAPKTATAVQNTSKSSPNELPASPNVSVVELTGPYPVWEQMALPNALPGQRLDVLHCTANTAPLRSSVPVVLTLHDIIFLEKAVVGGTWYQRFGNVYRRWNVPRVVKTSARILTVSHYERQRIIDHLGVDPARVTTVHNAVSRQFRVITDPEILTRVRAQYALPEQFIFFLGNPDPKKNVPNVLRALLLMKQRRQLTLPVVIANVTSAYVQDVLAQIDGQILTEDIILCGYIPNTVLPVVYNLAGVFLCPSLRESFGLPILEAMACGTPVLTASTSAMPEVAGEAALLANPASPDDMAQQLNRLLTDAALCHDLRQRGLARAALFSWQNTAKQLLTIYDEVVG
ncbi:glycosyltransferase family 4 protein [Fibrella sp. HMF5335]|uniref:Glycosyltransferase family 4 protein n=1 Tax=Fibrella rubiginis TaxID=2817060 RepID=A0A939GF38_9BACT|nr:glycosyltransferase family 1 protein [Fibrella rubiginis]MBO0935556.1 glycosyltransferase family 4 protein [Fibrella rubiginis]